MYCRRKARLTRPRTLVCAPPLIGLLLQMNHSVQAALTPLRLARGQVFAGLYILGCANGLFAKAMLSVHRLGWIDAVFGTFDISVVVLVACFIGLSFVSADNTGALNLVDLAVATLLLLLVALPIGAMSWLAVSLLSLYILLFRRSTQLQCRGAIILLAVTVPMMWSRLVFDLFANFILGVDAFLVAWMLGTGRSGNMVEFADGSGTLAIFPSCSSLANVSLAILCWVTVSQSVRHKWRVQDILWCLLACSSVVAVNVIRISLMGLSTTHYENLHTPLGETVSNIVLLILIVGISILGVRRDAFARD